MEITETKLIYQCDFPGCKEKSWLGNGHDWKMCEIVFGVDPRVVKERAEPVAVIQEKLHFCWEHSELRFHLLYLIIREHPVSNICTKPYFIEGLGCWITIHDCFFREPIRNFQLPYGVFERIFRDFRLSFPDIKNETRDPRVEKLRHLKCEQA